jgi:hypothetical protein
MKACLLLTSILFSSQLFAYDEKLMVNVEKANALLSRAHDSGFTPGGEACDVELRQIEDGYYTVYLKSGENKETMVGLDIAPYGRIYSHWTKNSLIIKHEGCFESQTLNMREDYATRKLVVKIKSDLSGKIDNVSCLLPLK